MYLVIFVNNDGTCLPSPEEACDEVYAKEQYLVHNNYVLSEQKMTLVDCIQGNLEGQTLVASQMRWLED